GRNDGVTGVDGEALGGVHSGGITQRNVLGYVVGRQCHPLTQLFAGLSPPVDRGHNQVPVVAGLQHAVVLAVDRAALVVGVVGKAPDVHTGLDDVSGTGVGALQP